MNWANLIPSVMMAFRSTPATESHGFSPFQLVFGKEMLLPVDLDLLPKPSMPAQAKIFFDELLGHIKIARDIAKQNMEVARQQAKQQHDKKAKAPDFQIGDKVLLHSNATKLGHSHKLSQKWFGPYEITSTGPNYTFQLRSCETNKLWKSLVNAQRLKHYQENIHADLADQDGTEDTSLSDNDPQTDEQAPQTQPEPQPSHQSQDQSQPVEVNVPQSKTVVDKHPQVDLNSRPVEVNVPQSETVVDRHPQVEPSPQSVEKPNKKHAQSAPQTEPANTTGPQTQTETGLVWPKRIFKVSMYGGQRWFRCYLEGHKNSKWLLEHQLDPDFLCEYWETHTRTGRYRKRKPKGKNKTYWNSKLKKK